MDTVPRMPPSVVRPALKTDNERPAILVCAYDDPAQCQSMHIDGAMTWRDFVKRLANVPREQQIILYCG